MKRIKFNILEIANLFIKFFVVIQAFLWAIYYIGFLAKMANIYLLQNFFFSAMSHSSSSFYFVIRTKLLV